MSNLHIFFFYFYKAPGSILKYIDKIGKQFIWGGNKDKSKIHWVKWEIMCSSKEKSGLDIKSLVEFNLALLSKWKWRILEDKKSLWKKVLKARYGSIEHQVLSENIRSRESNSSWWKDMIKSGATIANFGLFYAGSIGYKLGEGKFIPVWSASWYCSSPFDEIFHDMFASSKKKDAFVNSLGFWHEGIWNWGDLRVPLLLQDSFSENIRSLKVLLAAISPIMGSKDNISWNTENFSFYCVGEAYQLMLDNKVQDLLLIDQEKAFGCMWKIKVSAIILSFGFLE